MICRGASAYRLPLFRVMEVGMMESAGVTLLVYHVRFSFRRLRLVLLNARPGLRSMTVSGARGSFVVASHVRLNRRRVRRRKLRPRKLRRRKPRCHQSKRRRRRVQLLDLSRRVMKGAGVLCDRQWVRARNA